MSVTQSVAWATLVRLKIGSQPSDTGMIRVSKAVSRQDLHGYRAVFCYTGNGADGTRKFGSCRATVYEATMQMVCRLGDLLSPGEQQRICSSVKVMQMGPNLGWGPQAHAKRGLRAGSQPPAKRAKRDGTTPGPVVAESFSENVAYVHQIYGIYKDGKPKSDLFEESVRRWKQVAASCGAIYHLWTPDEIETLIRNEYPQYWPTYVNVRYPIQRVDMARILIAHFYGGLYSDMDVLPNRCEYARQQFAVCAVPAGLAAKDKAYFDMEVISANPRNPVLLKWMDYIQKQIQEKDYHAEDSVWKTRRMRYVYHTTGPAALKRFLDGLKDYKSLGRIACNRFDEYENLTPVQKQAYDVLTRRSNSYFTNEFEIHVPVSTEDVPLPIPYTKLSHRMSVKTWIRGTTKPWARSHAMPKSSGAGDGAAGGDIAAERLPGAQPPSPVPTIAFEDEQIDVEKQLLKTVLDYFHKYEMRVSMAALEEILEKTFQMDHETVALVFQRLPDFALEAVRTGAPSQGPPSECVRLPTAPSHAGPSQARPKQQ